MRSHKIVIRSNNEKKILEISFTHLSNYFNLMSLQIFTNQKNSDKIFYSYNAKQTCSYYQQEIVNLKHILYQINNIIYTLNQNNLKKRKINLF